MSDPVVGRVEFAPRDPIAHQLNYGSRVTLHPRDPGHAGPVSVMQGVLRHELTKCTYTDDELHRVIDHMLPEALLDRIGATRDRDLVLRLTRICDELQRLTLNDTLEETVDAAVPTIDTPSCAVDPYAPAARLHSDHTRKKASPRDVSQDPKNLARFWREVDTFHRGDTGGK